MKVGGLRKKFLKHYWNFTPVLFSHIQHNPCVFFKKNSPQYRTAPPPSVNSQGVRQVLHQSCICVQSMEYFMPSILLALKPRNALKQGCQWSQKKDWCLQVSKFHLPNLSNSDCRLSSETCSHNGISHALWYELCTRRQWLWHNMHNLEICCWSLLSSFIECTPLTFDITLTNG